jgi:hypothetical protein
MPLYTGQLNGDLINLGVFGLKSVTLRTAQGRVLCNTQYKVPNYFQMLN